MYGQTRYTRPSRFLQEIPQDLLDSNLNERARAPQQVSTQPHNHYQPRSTIKPTYRAASVLQTSISSLPAPSFACGDRVIHRVFGEGMVTSVKPMGGDQLLEIAFTAKGTKRLMAKSASQFMHKI